MAATEGERFSLNNANVTYKIETEKVTYEDVIYVTPSVANERTSKVQEVKASSDWGTIDNTTGSPYQNICWVKSTFSNGVFKYGSGVLVDLNISFNTYQLYTYYTNPSDMLLKNIVEYVYPNNSNQFYSNTFVINATDTVINHYAAVNGSGGDIIDSSNSMLVGIDTSNTIVPMGGEEYRESVRINGDLYNRIKAHCGN